MANRNGKHASSSTHGAKKKDAASKSRHAMHSSDSPSKHGSHSSEKSAHSSHSGRSKS